MKVSLLFLFIALFATGCWESEEHVEQEGKGELDIPLIIPCEACKTELSKESTSCPDCGHPTKSSLAAYAKNREEHKNSGKGLVGEYFERRERQKQELFRERQIRELQTTFISIDETPRGRKFYRGVLENERTEIHFSQIREGLRYREGWQVVLRVAPKVPHAEVLDAMKEIGNGGMPGFIYRPWLDSENKDRLNDRESVANAEGSYHIKLPGIPSSFELNAMPRLHLRIGDLGKVYINGSEIEDGTNSSMPDLVANLKAQKGMRDQLIASGRPRETTELRVFIDSSGIAEASSGFNVLNACAKAGVQEFTFFPGPADLKQEKQKTVKLMQRQRRVQPSKQIIRTQAISDIALPDFNEVEVKDLSPVESGNPSALQSKPLNNLAVNRAVTGIGLSLPKSMQQRCDPKKRLARLRSGGGQEFTEAAILRGLDWLKANQDPEGSWGGKDKDAQGNPKATNKDAMTSMALLCFLGHCELQDSPKYGPTVRKAIEYITSTPPDKPVGGGNTGSYSHPIRTYALCEAYTMTKNKRLEEFAKRATIHLIKGQNETGGWAYAYGKGPTAHTDLSVTGWHVQALKAAALTGIPIEGLDQAMDKAIEYVRKCQDQTGKFAYKIKSSGKASLTGTGVLSLQMWKNAKTAEAQKGLDWIVANQAKEWRRVNVYEWYYHAQACFQATGVSGGSKYWRAWNKDFQQIVCGAQQPDGHWPHGTHFHGDTAIFRTTMTILMLEVYYRYMPNYGGP